MSNITNYMSKYQIGRAKLINDQPIILCPSFQKVQLINHIKVVIIQKKSYMLQYFNTQYSDL